LLGQPSRFTYANGSQWCVSVDYQFPAFPQEKSCWLEFYVPFSNATAYLPFGFYDTNNNKKYFHLAEDATQSYQFIFAKQIGEDDPIYKVNFSDNNGQQYPTMIGWRKDNGLQRFCTNVALPANVAPGNPVFN
jgi:hypothetical protein